MSKKKPSLIEILDANRTIIIALLGLPVLGMAVAVVMILYVRPAAAVTALGIITFVAVQYILMMFFLLKKIEIMAKKSRESEFTTHEDHVEEVETKAQSVEEFTHLPPEEQRIFDVEKTRTKLEDDKNQ